MTRNTIVSVPLEVPVADVQAYLTKLAAVGHGDIGAITTLDRRGGRIDLWVGDGPQLTIYLQGAPPEPDIPDWVLDVQEARLGASRIVSIERS